MACKSVFAVKEFIISSLSLRLLACHCVKTVNFLGLFCCTCSLNRFINVLMRVQLEFDVFNLCSFTKTIPTDDFLE